MKEKPKKNFSERKEALFRIVVAFVSGLILEVWSNFILILLIVNFFITLFTKRRNEDLAIFCEYWNTEFYKFCKYITFVTNKRPFPFSKLEKMGRFEW